MLKVGKLHNMKVEVFGFDTAIRSMRNPKNSWYKNDSYFTDETYSLSPDGYFRPNCKREFVLGKNDKKLACSLISAGSEHRKFLRMIHCQFDVNAPLYWYKEMDTYKVGTTCNSCSTMHKLLAKEFSMDDFSIDMVKTGYGRVKFEELVSYLNELRTAYLNDVVKEKEIWYEIIQLLPSSYMQIRTYDMDYETLLNIYNQRKNHKLFEWHIFVNELILNLPYMLEFIEAFNKN